MKQATTSKTIESFRKIAKNLISRSRPPAWALFSSSSACRPSPPAPRRRRPAAPSRCRARAARSAESPTASGRDARRRRTATGRQSGPGWGPGAAGRPGAGWQKRRWPPGARRASIGDQSPARPRPSRAGAERRIKISLVNRVFSGKFFLRKCSKKGNSGVLPNISHVSFSSTNFFSFFIFFYCMCDSYSMPTVTSFFYQFTR